MQGQAFDAVEAVGQVRRPRRRARGRAVGLVLDQQHRLGRGRHQGRHRLGVAAARQAQQPAVDQLAGGRLRSAASARTARRAASRLAKPSSTSARPPGSGIGAQRRLGEHGQRPLRADQQPGQVQVAVGAARRAAGSRSG